MPTYEYRCTQCKKRFELLQKITDPPIKRCPSCKGKPERLISSGAGLIFKGSGFYITDYKRRATGSGESAQTPKGPEKKSSSKKESS